VEVVCYTVSSCICLSEHIVQLIMACVSLSEGTLTKTTFHHGRGGVAEGGARGAAPLALLWHCPWVKITKSNQKSNVKIVGLPHHISENDRILMKSGRRMINAYLKLKP